ncbi:AAA family ATPase, partial [Chondromyces apiculatus]|uniref:AAA family ATPase n=1 Tax=Chondromyces apiculatus TaxID=51 RepID=UPI0005C4B0D4
MNRAVRLVDLTVRNVGPLVGTVKLGPFVEGINVISGGNEAGKSTIVEALRAGLFERSGTRHQGMQALQPHGTRLGPEVEITLSLDGEVIQVHKRFLEKAMTEVRLGDGTTVRNRDADELLLQRLEGRSPKKGAVSREDMGVWGLLWVTQDETAHEDPGSTLGDEVRGALAEAVGRQVGVLTGGKHGERIRTRVIEEVGRFYTPRREQPAPELKRAEDRRVKADARVEAITTKMQACEGWRQRWATDSVKLAEVDRTLPALRAELAEAQRRARALEKEEAHLGELRARALAAEAICMARQRDTDARGEMAAAVEALAGEVAREQQRLAEMVRFFAVRIAEEKEAREALSGFDGVLGQMRARWDALQVTLARAHVMAEASRLAQDVQRAEAVAEEIAEVERARAWHALEGGTYDEMQALAKRQEVLRARLEAEGTRVVARGRG